MVCCAQQTGQIELDRPDQTETPIIVPKRWFQAELGFNVEKNQEGLTQLVHPTILSKYGLSNRIEIRLITEYITQETSRQVTSGNNAITGLVPVQIGGKLSLSEEIKWMPKTSFIVHLVIPKAATKEFRQTNWAPNFRFVMQNTLSNSVALGYNIGAEWDGNTKDPSWVYTLAPGFNLSERIYFYVEAFGLLKKGEHPQHALDGGFAYAITKNIKIDLSGGNRISHYNELNYYFSLGFSFRIPL